VSPDGEAWFSALGTPLGEGERAEIAAYLLGMGFAAEVDVVTSWREAFQIGASGAGMVERRRRPSAAGWKHGLGPVLRARRAPAARTRSFTSTPCTAAAAGRSVCMTGASQSFDERR
jgi:hypothetical protein